MSVYKFRLQKLLEIRKAKEEESKIQFKEALIEKNKIEVNLKNLYESFNKYKTVAMEENIIDKKMRERYLNALTISINSTKKSLNEKEIILEEKRSALEKKQVERKTVEKLKEKKLTEFNKEQDDIEQKNNDEFALYGYIRNDFERR